MNHTGLEHLTSKGCEIVKEVGKFIKSERGKVSFDQIEEKGLNSLVSYVDKTAEEKLVSQLAALLPESTFLTEEETVEQKTGKFRWIIDPLDGTTNFLHQLPCYAVSVALEIEGSMKVGIVYEPNNDECFYAYAGGGAYLNGHPIKVSTTEKLENALVATGFPYHDYRRETAYFKAFNQFMKNTRGIRRWGAAAVDLAYVACGRFDAFYEYGLNAWDVAAGTLIVKEAGGKVADFNGGKNYLFGKEMIASNQNLFESAKKIISEAFQP
ncbi:MAG: inositol monophosphatase family protein [Bacteroidota bacterium]